MKLQTLQGGKGTSRHLSLYGTGSLIISICDIILQGPTENNVNGSSKHTFDVQVAWTLGI